MSQTRLNTALDGGALALPEGPVAVIRPSAGYDLDGLPRAGLTVVHSFKPDIDHWQRAGLATAQDIPAVTAAIVVVPRSKTLARGLIAAACDKAQIVVVDGQKTDGIDSLFRDCKARLGDIESVAKAHGRLFWFAASGDFADWRIGAPQPGPEGFVTTPGVYAESAVDSGSALLAAALPRKLPRRMADFGAGWGYLSAAVLANPDVTSLDLIEAEGLALDCARLNITDPRARFVWEDVTSYRADTPYDGIVMNPPFHAGRAADPDIGRAFIAAAARNLTAGGQLWMVANRHLPYEAALTAHFRNVAEFGGDRAFKLIHATRPKR